MRCCSDTSSCLTLCDPMDCSTSGFPVHHQLPELAQTHVHRVSGDSIQTSHPLPASSPPVFNLSFPTSGSFLMSWLFTSGGQSIRVSVYAPMNSTNSGLSGDVVFSMGKKKKSESHLDLCSSNPYCSSVNCISLLESHIIIWRRKWQPTLVFLP